MLGILCLGAARLVAADPLIHENHIATYNDRVDISITDLVVDEVEIWNDPLTESEGVVARGPGRPEPASQRVYTLQRPQEFQLFLVEHKLGILVPPLLAAR